MCALRACAVYVGGFSFAVALRLDKGLVGSSWQEQDFDSSGVTHVARLLGKDLLFELDSAGVDVDAWKLRPSREPVPRPPTPDAVTIVLTHLPISMDNMWLVKWMDAVGSDAAVFADVRPSLSEHGACHNVGYITFASYASAARFFRRMGRFGECGECTCEASWASPARQGLETQVRDVVFRRKTAPMARDSEGKWALAEKLPFVKPNATTWWFQAFRELPGVVREQEFTTVLVDGLPHEYVNAHLVDWLQRLGSPGLHANFARLLQSPSRGSFTKAVVNFDSHAAAEEFIRHVRKREASPCSGHSRYQEVYSAVWAPRGSQGFDAQMVDIPGWFGGTLFRDAGGVWQRLRVNPFNDLTTGVRLMGGAHVRVNKPRGCGLLA